MKKLFLILAIIGMLSSCAPAHVYDLEYKIEGYWVRQGGKYKYVYILYNGKKMIYLHSNNKYDAMKTFNINQN